jgi:hypothetical protein
MRRKFQVSEEKSLKWIQRDLEDQINEEKLKIMANVPTVPSKVQIRIEEVLADLKKGLTRYAKDDKGYGSIQVKHNLSLPQVRKLFKDPRLAGRRSSPKDSVETFELVSDTPSIELIASDQIARTEEEIERALDAGEISAEGAIDQKEALFS